MREFVKLIEAMENDIDAFFTVLSVVILGVIVFIAFLDESLTCAILSIFMYCSVIGESIRLSEWMKKNLNDTKKK